MPTTRCRGCDQGSTPPIPTTSLENPLGPADGTAHGTRAGRVADRADRGIAQWAVGEVRVTGRMRDKSQRHLHDGTPAGYCEGCSKYTYISRAAAKKRRKR